MKLSRLLSFIAFVFSCVVVLPVFAETTTIGEITAASKKTGDLSRQALATIYGDVVNNPLASSEAGGVDTILASIFQVLNGALLVVGSLWACYIIFRKLTRTAHDGAVFDKQNTTVWGPVRIVWGLVSLVPTANGWSLSQLLMLWSASTMGIGIANLSTDAAISAFEDGKGMVVQPAMPSTLQLAHNLFEANICMHGINAGLAEAAAQGGLVTQGGYVQQVPTSSGFTLKNKSFICGGADINADLEAQSSSTNWFSTTIDTSQIRKAHLDALVAMQNTITKSALNFVNEVVQKKNGAGDISDVEGVIQSAAQAYEITVNQSVGTKQGDIEALANQMSTSITEAGWWSLGAWYQTFAQANTKLTDAVAAKAGSYGPSSGGDPAVVNLYQSAMDAYAVQKSTNTNANPLGANGSQGTETSKVMSHLFAPMQKITTSLVTDVNFNGEHGGQLNPLIKMKNLGDTLMGTAEVAVATYGGLKALERVTDGNSAVGLTTKFVNFFSGGLDAGKGLLDAMSPFIIMAIFALFLLGATLSIYLPMTPFIIWFGAAINWLVVVGEAIIAAPLWAFTHLGGEGDGMGQRTAHGYLFLLNCMFRPTLMVVGFFLGGAIVVAGGTLLNNLFGIAIANVQYDSMTGIFSALFFVAVYCSMCLNLIHSSFNLIFIVPDQVINWVGGQASATVGRDDNDRTRQAISVFAGKLEHMAPKSGMPGRKPGNSKPSGGDGIHG